MEKPVLLRITTVPVSLKILMRGQLLFMKQNGFEVIAVSAGGKEVESLKRTEQVPHVSISLTRTISPFADFRALISLIAIIRKYKPVIVHTHTPKAGLIGMLAAWFCNVPVRLHTVAGMPLMEAGGLLRVILYWSEKITYWCSHFVFPNSSGLRDILINKMDFSPEKVKILGRGSSNGIDTDYFSATPLIRKSAHELRQRYNISSEDVVFSFVGRVVRDKGIVELVEAFRSLRDQHDTTKNHSRFFLLIVGNFEHELDPLPQDILDFLSNDPHIILAGFQEDVRPWIVASDIFVFPSYREGFPNVVMQASLLKVPCIVSDINGCNEIISHNVSGLIVPAKDAMALTHAMRVLAGDAYKRIALAEEAHKHVFNNFAQKYVWNEIKKEYQRLLVVSKE